jgi:hypothetical protein
VTPNLRRGRAAGDAVLSRRSRVEQVTLGHQEPASAGSLNGDPTHTSEPLGPPRRSSCGGVPRRSWPRPSQRIPLVLATQEPAAPCPCRTRQEPAVPRPAPPRPHQPRPSSRAVLRLGFKPLEAAVVFVPGRRIGNG